MCRPLPLCLAMATAVLAADVHAQSTAEYRRLVDDLLRTRPRVDSLMKLRTEARIARLPVDTVRVGDLMVLTVPAHRLRVQELADRAWTRISATFGSAAAILRRQVYIAQFTGDDVIHAQTGASPVGMADSGTAADLIQVISMALYQATDTTLHAWLEEPYVPRDDDRKHDEPLYVELVTSPWHEVQTCYAGDLVACRLALGLVGRESSWAQWYDASDRRRLVEQVFRGSPHAGKCVTQQEDAACLAALRSESRGGTPAPFSRRARRSLLAFALRTGGPGAYERLVARDGELERRLGLAAGSTTASLVAAWRERILSAHPKTLDFAAASAWATVAWCMVLATLSFRSSRWR